MFKITSIILLATVLAVGKALYVRQRHVRENQRHWHDVGNIGKADQYVGNIGRANRYLGNIGRAGRYMGNIGSAHRYMGNIEKEDTKYRSHLNIINGLEAQQQNEDILKQIYMERIKTEKMKSKLWKTFRKCSQFFKNIWECLRGKLVPIHNDDSMLNLESRADDIEEVSIIEEVTWPITTLAPELRSVEQLQFTNIPTQERKQRGSRQTQGQWFHF
uniref:Uncharacterized protein n=1 Tax=Clastoptera arizonana TaxID=38151 RepID=A0A1B6CDB1_9HEMI